MNERGLQILHFAKFPNELTMENEQTPVLTRHGYNIAIKKVSRLTMRITQPHQQLLAVLYLRTPPYIKHIWTKMQYTVHALKNTY